MSQKKTMSSPSISNSSSDELRDSPVLPSGSPRRGGGYDSSSSSSASGEAEIKDVDGKFNLLRAAEVGDLEEVKRIIAAEPDKVNLTDANGYTALHRACYNDHVEVARELISNGADYVKKTVDGWEPLHSAARWGATRCVEILLDLPGVDINAKTKGGVTPLHLAVLNAEHRETVIELLMHPGVDTRIVSEGRQTPFEVARSASELYRLFEVTEPMFNL